MKNLFFSYWTTFAFVGMIYLLSGCQSYIGEESLALESGNVQTKAEELPYIEIDLSTLSRKDTAVFALYMEAQNRMDKFIDYQDGQYVLNAKSGAEMNISESLFLNLGSNNDYSVNEDLDRESIWAEMEMQVTYDQLQQILDYNRDAANLDWGVYNNCTDYSISVWNLISDEKIPIDEFGSIVTPKALSDYINNKK